MNEHDCIICYQQSKTKMPCCAAFCHQECLEPWLKTANRCPHCQSEITSKIEKRPNLFTIAYHVAHSCYIWFTPPYCQLVFIMIYLIEKQAWSLSNIQLDAMFENWIENKPVLRENETMVLATLQNIGLRFLVVMIGWYFAVFRFICLFISTTNYISNGITTTWFSRHKVIELIQF